MGVTTDADLMRRRFVEDMEKVSTSIDASINCLQQFVNKDTWGTNDYPQSVIDEANEDILTILKLKNKLNKIKNKY